MTKRINRRDFIRLTAVGTGGCCLGLAPVAGASANAQSAPEAVKDASCGLYCGACGLFQASIKARAEGNEKGVVCLGCKSQMVADHCKKCQIRDCVQAKGFESCAPCAAFPCAKGLSFYESGRPFALLAEKNIDEIRHKGRTDWLKEQEKRWQCPHCGSLFSFADEVCPSCGKDVYSSAEESAEYAKTRG